MTWPRPSLTSPVTAAGQASTIASYIEEQFAQPRGGVVKIMESMWHLWEEILSATDTPRVLVCCTGENPRGSFAEQDQWCRVDRQWTVAVVYGRGFRNLMPDAEGNPPGVSETMTASVEALRDCIRVINSVSEEFPVNYKGWKNLPAVARPGTANVFVAGALIELSTANDIPQISEPA